MEKMEFKFTDSNGNEQHCWINKQEWDFLRAFRHRKVQFLHVFGSRAIGLSDVPITEEESNLFNEWYAEKYPEYNKMLGKEDIEKLNEKIISQSKE